MRVGISGWRYPPWRGTFYPVGLPQRCELEHASRRVRTIEINGSFYSLQRPSSYERWYAQTPADFLFSVKGGRFITHNKKLRDCRVPMANFFASGVLRLADKLGPVLWQLPPQLRFDAERLHEFFDLLPRTTREAARLARAHDARVAGRVWLEVDRDRPIRHALEVRHDSFHDAAFLPLLRKHAIALCVADAAGKWPYIEEATADFVYLRLHGGTRLYASGYDGAALDRWAALVAAWRDGASSSDDARHTGRPRDVYVYFDNDAKVRAPFDAINLAARLGYGERAPFPRKAHREAAAKRASRPRVERADDRWRAGARRAGSA